MIHRDLGLTAMVFLAIAAITGCILCFAKPLDRALNADLFYRQGHRTASPRSMPSSASSPLSPRSGSPDFPERRAGPEYSVDVAPAPGTPPIAFDQLFLDGGDGHVVGTRSKAPGWGRRGIVAGIADFHFNLLGGRLGAMADGRDGARLVRQQSRRRLSHLARASGPGSATGNGCGASAFAASSRG